MCSTNQTRAGGWQIFARRRLENTIFTTGRDTQAAFVKIAEQWLFEPQQITKTILRGDVLEDTNFLPEKGFGLLRTTYRRLLPRSPHKDTHIFQKVELISTPEALFVEHTPLFHPGNQSLASDFDITSLKPGDCCQSTFPSFHPEVSGYRLYMDFADGVVKADAWFGSDKCIDLHSSKVARTLGKMLDLLVKFMANHLKGYVKRVNHDVIIPKVKYQNKYHEVKGKFNHWVAKWPEATDPAKYVFEELGIATFLHLLWNKKSSFVDLGCGNGFLTHVLSELGHTGRGIDISKRQIWEMYPASTVLEVETIVPSNQTYAEEWLVGNHSDELTPWIPVMAALSGYDTKFMILPCCFYDFSGKKYSGVMDGRVGKYENYCLYLQAIMERCGYVPEPEYLRIPSTKNLAWVGRRRTFERGDLAKEETILNQIMAMVQGVHFQPRKSDTEKSKMWAEKMKH